MFVSIMQRDTGNKLNFCSINICVM